MATLVYSAFTFVGDVPWALAMVLVSIGATSYDGAQEGALKSPIESTFDLFRDLGLDVTAAFRVNGTLWMAIVIAAVCLLYTLGVRGMHTVKGSPPVRPASATRSPTAGS